MNSKEAGDLLNKGGKIRLPEWTGYWFLESNSMQIMAFTRTGDIVPAWVGSPADISIVNREDWQEVTEGLGFDFAILALKAGKRVARAGWNGKNMHLQHVRPAAFCKGTFSDSNYPLLPWIGMKTADDKFVPWLASQTDMLATDWEIAQ